MYSLKREAIQQKLYPSVPIPCWRRSSTRWSPVRRSSEFWLVLRMALRTNPLQLLTWRVGLATDANGQLGW